MSDRPTTPEQARHRLASALLELDPAVQDLAERFAAAGHELALVGGPVRDALLGRRAPDLDFTTDAVPDVTERLVSRWADAVWDIGNAFGTIGARRGDLVVEITTYRSERYDPASRKPEVAFGDYARGRPAPARLHGQRDGRRLPSPRVRRPVRRVGRPGRGPVLRTPGTAEESFSDDPLRMMRAARFAAQLGFAVAPEVVAAMTAMAERIEIVSAERVRDELSKLVLAHRPARGLRAARRHRARRPRAARAAGAARSRSTSTTGTRTSTSTR